MKWLEFDVDKGKVNRLSKALKISEFLAKLLIQRNIEDPDSAQKFLHPSLNDLEDPYDILNVYDGIECLEFAIAHQRKIAIIGDYDVDGITSVALLSRCFQFFNLPFTPFVPHRETEGYGLTQGLLDRINAKENFGLIFALDCGTNSAKLIRQLREQGQDVIVIDHHQPKEEIPECVLINPHVWPEKHTVSAQQLCTVGLVFKFIHAWLKRLRETANNRAINFKLKPFLDLVALGTVADMVPLKNENRIFVHYGLKQLKKSIIPGVQALISTSYADPDPEITVEDISFKLAPRINASGRLSSADLPLDLLLEDNLQQCLLWAEQLTELNQDRQNVEKAICLEAEDVIRGKFSDNDKLWILYKPHWHIGVVGIVAGRLSRKYNRPVIVLGQQGDFAKGSGRAIEAVNLVELLEKSTKFLHQWGGHPLAVGVTILPENVLPVEAYLNQYLAEKFPLGLPDKTLSLSGQLTLSELTLHLAEDIERLQPFGQGNPSPVFCLSNIQLPPIEYFGADRANFRCNLPTAFPMSLIGWGFGEDFKKMSSQAQKIDIAVKTTWNTFRQVCQLQLQLVDLRLPRA